MASTEVAPREQRDPPDVPAGPAERTVSNDASAQVTRGSVPLLTIAVIAALSLGAFLLGAGYVVGHDRAEERLVAVAWGDGRYGPAFYGAYVYLVPQGDGFSVRARVMLGRGNDHRHECGELGTARTAAEAVARWGKLDWRSDGLAIGEGESRFFLPRATFENHR